MEKTIKHLEDKGLLERLRTSTEIANTLYKMLNEKIPENGKKKAYEEVIMREMARDKALLDAIIDDVTNEIIKHI